VNLAGVEDGLQFWGGSRLVGPTGDVLAKAAYDQEDFLVCEADLADLRTVETFVPTLRDLRPEFYDKLKVLSEQF
jgi:predicted amidohydrolase